MGGEESGGGVNPDSDKKSYINRSKTTTAKHAKAQLGVLSDATVKIYGLGDHTKKLLFTETTTAGSTIDQIGNFNAHENELLDDTYYLYEVSAGKDWDTDDDGVVNQSPMENRGTFRAVIKGRDVKNLGGKIIISAISNISYVKVKDYLKTSDILDDKLNSASTRIINDDLNGDGIIDSKDVMQYDPINHKNKLDEVYRGKLDAILYDIHKGGYVDIAVKPIIKGGTFTISKDITDGMVVGKVEIIDDGQENINFEFVGSNYVFSINENGDIYVSNPNRLNIQTYNLKVYAYNRAGRSKTVDIVINIEKSSDKNGPLILADSYIEKLETDKSDITFIIKDSLSFKVELEGEDKDNLYFQKDKYDVYHLYVKDRSGNINYSHPADFEFPSDANRDNTYNVIIKATDSAGNVSRKPISIKIENELDERPILERTYTEFVKRDNFKSDLNNGDIFLGKVKVYYEGDSQIDTFKMYGLPFLRVDEEGKVFFKSDTSYLDELSEEDGERDKAVKLRDDFIKKLQTEGEITSISIKAYNQSYPHNSITGGLSIITTIKNDYPIKPHILSTYEANSFSISPDGKIIFADILRNDIYQLFDVTDPNKFKLIDSNIGKKIKNDIYLPKMIFSSDGNIAYVAYKYEVDARTSKRAIKILDMRNKREIKYLGRVVG